MIWIVGSGGMLGRELVEVFAARGIEALGSGRELDFTDLPALEAFAVSRWPAEEPRGAEPSAGEPSAGEPSAAAPRRGGRALSWIVNCAAYTAVDKAESEPEAARSLNVEGPANLARLASRRGARLLHISTDYVFDGKGTRPYLESDELGPTGVYGATKAEGERVVFEECPSALVLRTAWLYGRHGPNFVRSMLRLMAERESLGVVADQRGTPTWAADLAGAIADIVSRGEPGPEAGIYHYTDAGETSWYDFAREILRLGREAGLLERGCELKPLSTAEYPTPARRPAYSVLSKDKIERVFGIVPPRWEESLAKYIAGIK
ncbi:MAG TPA: dTDP-4-dehydrorhamnose reductase [Rectinemataceae bacterium]|nr:dTDP-4-dehydrorhamnose reductase [Rectinemataceae bacterium]